MTFQSHLKNYGRHAISAMNVVALVGTLLVPLNRGFDQRPSKAPGIAETDAGRRRDDACVPWGRSRLI